MKWSLKQITRKNCFRYLKLMSPLNGPDKKILFKKQLFDLEVKGQGLTKVIMECDTLTIWSGWNSEAILIAYFYVSPSNEGRHIVLVWFFLPLLLLLLSEACPDHNFFVFPTTLNHVLISPYRSFWCIIDVRLLKTIDWQKSYWLI
jgi:hypothetical protein